MFSDAQRLGMPKDMPPRFYHIFRALMHQRWYG
jgi:hypothetical protein